MKKRLHILFISNWFPNRTSSFSGDFVQRHAQAIATQHKVSIIHAIGEKNLMQSEIIEKKHSDSYTEFLFYFPKSKFKGINFYRKIKGLSILKKRISKVDLIHANVIHFHFIWLLFQKEKYIFSEHSSQFLEINIRKLSTLKKIIFKPIFKKADYLLPVSNALKKGLLTFVDLEKIEIIPNVVDVTTFNLQPKKNTQITFLHLSNLKEVKNILGLLQSIKTIADKGYNFKFKIGGNGDLEPIKNFVKKHNLKKTIEILPALQHTDVAKEMQNATCFVLFSNYENQPCVIIESFACGLPVISTNVGGIAENFPGNFGLLIEKGNSIQLVNSMIKVIEGKKFAPPLTMHNYVKENFSIQAIVNKFDGIYTKLIS